jgi:DNA-binding beta-propeller fold protein YncE
VRFFAALMLSAYAGSLLAAVQAQGTTAGEPTPSGKLITPAAAKGASFQSLNPGHANAPEVRAGYASAVAVSPDGKWLAIQTSGYNVFADPSGKTTPNLSSEYVFLFDITGPQPKQRQVLTLPRTFQGLAWAPSSDRLFVSGGADDLVAEFVRRDSGFVSGRTFSLGHSTCIGRTDLSATARFASVPTYARCGVEAAGVAVSPDGTRLLVANLQNDSVSLLDLSSGKVVFEQDLRPGNIDPAQRGRPGGSFPRAVIWTSADRAYVTSERDREIIALAAANDTLRVIRRVSVQGRPLALATNRSGSRLYAALDSTGQVAIFDTTRDTLIESLSVTAPADVYANRLGLGGANTNALTLTPDERTLLVTNGGQNSVAVVRLGEGKPSVVTGLVPTGWYPTGVATSSDGQFWYVVNAKSPMGANSKWCEQVDATRGVCVPRKHVEYEPAQAENGIDNVLRRENLLAHQLERAGFLTLPVPDAAELARLTRQVARNNRLDQPDMTEADKRLFAFLRERIKHVIYIIKENRSYDQVLGDLQPGNGDPRLTVFPERITPNQHALARRFVTVDNFLVSGEASFAGWDWVFCGQTTDLEERAEPLFMRTEHMHRQHGLFPGSWINRGLNLGYATSAERRERDPSSPADPNILPGAVSPFAPDGAGGEPGTGTIWDAALRKGLSVRSYGVFVESLLETVRTPYAQKREVSWGTWPSLMPHVDPYFTGFTTKLPDYWRVQEWRREFAQFSEKKSAPQLMVVSLHGDHIGKVTAGADGVNTPELQVADNDYAFGLLVQTVANSPLAQSTLIVSVEDNAFDGPDHVDAQRSMVFFAGPYVRRGGVVSTRYTTVNVVKTIEAILGIGPIGLNDAVAAPMSEVFDRAADRWSYEATVPEILRTTQLPLDRPGIVPSGRD